MKKFLISLASTIFLLSLVFVPVYAGAQTTGKSLGLFPCTGVVDPKDNKSKECTFNDLLRLADNIIKTIFIAILVVSPVLIAYVGYLYIISGDKPAERAKASGLLLNMVIGLVIVASSYTVVKLVLNALLEPTTITTFF